MEIDVLRELQERGRFFWEMFPGAKASDEWQQQREQIEWNEKTERSSPAAVDGDKDAKAPDAK